MLSVSPSSKSKTNLENSGGKSPLKENLQRILERISDAEKRASRPAGSVILIAVSKTKSSDSVGELADLGILNFGENYVQEAMRKIEKVKSVKPYLNLNWHFIGTLQTNKSKTVVGKFASIQSIDRFDLAKALSGRAKESGVIQNIFVQIKLGDEPTKGGVSAEEAPTLIKKIGELENLKIQGLMAIPPMEAEAEGSRKYFVQLRQYLQQWKNLVPENKGEFKDLSMGTTHDFEVAIEEGATMVRVGTAIFGQREKI